MHEYLAVLLKKKQTKKFFGMTVTVCIFMFYISMGKVIHTKSILICQKTTVPYYVQCLFPVLFSLRTPKQP